jgi:hypothetical protein
MFCVPGFIFCVFEVVGSRFHVLRPRTSFRLYRERQVPFSYFALSESFLMVPRASGPIFIYSLPDTFSMMLTASGPVFMFSGPGLVFDGTDGVGYRFHVLRSRTRFLRYRGRRVPFSCFALPDSFSAVRRDSGLVFMFRTFAIVFGGIEGVGPRFIVLLSRTSFRRSQRRPLPFSTVPRASGNFFLFCTPRLVFGGTGGVESRFHILPA